MKVKKKEKVEPTQNGTTRSITLKLVGLKMTTLKPFRRRIVL